MLHDPQSVFPCPGRPPIHTSHAKSKFTFACQEATKSEPIIWGKQINYFFEQKPRRPNSSTAKDQAVLFVQGRALQLVRVVEQIDVLQD